jgi:hypothetical protein
MKSIRIGAGAGFAGDRIEPAVELVEQGELDFLCFECLAERTIALAQLARQRDPPPAMIPGWSGACVPCSARPWRGACASCPTWARPTRLPPWKPRSPSRESWD